MRRKLLDLGAAVVGKAPFPISRRTKRILKVLVVLPPVGALLGYAGLEYSAQPRFCVMCHYMKPFYEAWKTSSHNQVSCVQCHIPPGAKGFVRHKFAASVQLVKYITRQYGTRPWTEVEDASCLREGCHETRLLAGKVQFGGVQFDHGPHLTSFRRVTRMRCTSCHAQIVQGTHMTVTEAACFLCHFKNTQEAPEMADCRLCHKEIRPHRREEVSSEAWQPPSTPSRERSTYDHRLVLERGVDCRECHTDVVQGRGEVPRNRCLVCHSEPERLAKYWDTEFMHRHHVTEHKVDCLRCHIEIQHRLVPSQEQAQARCQSCHPNHHASTVDLYRGQGGAGVKGIPNPMFEVRVPCEGCHLIHQEVEGRGISRRAGAAGCMNCHGEIYGKTLAEWQMKSAAWKPWMETVLAQAGAALQEKGPGSLPGERSGPAWELYRQAEEHINLVQSGHAVHNVDYAEKLLQAAARALNRALELSGATYRVPPLPKASRERPEACLDCHQGIEFVRGRPFGVPFEHAPHLLRGQLKCQRCHRDTLNPADRQHGQLLLKQSDCQDCHRRMRQASPHPSGWLQAHGSPAQENQQACQTCHLSEECSRCHGLAMPHPSDWAVTHPRTASQALCRRCHEPQYCRNCHGLDLPHPQGWTQRLHQTAVKRTPDLCRRCHTDWFCRSCHKVDMPHPASWRQKHGPHAERQAHLCVRCHRQPSECWKCHRTKPPASHGEGWNKRHGKLVQEGQPLCQACHGSCRSCHGVAMPHPAGWLPAGHGAQASWKADSPCFRCHKPTYCQQCHETSEGGEEVERSSAKKEVSDLLLRAGGKSATSHLPEPRAGIIMGKEIIPYATEKVPPALVDADRPGRSGGPVPAMGSSRRGAHLRGH